MPAVSRMKNPTGSKAETLKAEMLKAATGGRGTALAVHGTQDRRPSSLPERIFKIWRQAGRLFYDAAAGNAPVPALRRAKRRRAHCWNDSRYR